MNTIECAVDLQPFQRESYSQHRTSRTKNVTFPSLMKNMSCFTNESTVGGLALPGPGQFVNLAPSSAGCTAVVSVVIMSEKIELMETTEPPLALDTAGETRGSLVFQDTIRRDMAEGM